MDQLKKFRKRIKLSLSLGTWMQNQSSVVAKNLSLSNAEWIVIDLEHGFFSYDRIPELIEVIKNQKKLVFARLAENSNKEIKKLLESGVDGLIFPRIKDGKEIKRYIANSYYPPIGNRSFGFSNDNNYGLKKKNLNFNPFLIAMIENMSAVNDLEEIVKSKRLDAIIVGKYDLQLSFKNNNKFNKFKKFDDLINYIFKVAKKNNIVYGIHIVENNKNEVQKFKKKGCNFLPVSIDTVHLQKIL